MSLLSFSSFLRLMGFIYLLSPKAFFSESIFQSEGISYSISEALCSSPVQSCCYQPLPLGPSLCAHDTLAIWGLHWSPLAMSISCSLMDGLLSFFLYPCILHLCTAGCQPPTECSLCYQAADLELYTPELISSHG